MTRRTIFYFLLIFLFSQVPAHTSFQVLSLQFILSAVINGIEANTGTRPQNGSQMQTSAKNRYTLFGINNPCPRFEMGPCTGIVLLVLVSMFLAVTNQHGLVCN